MMDMVESTQWVTRMALLAGENDDKPLDLDMAVPIFQRNNKSWPQEGQHG